jgi:hypothetical protein
LDGRFLTVCSKRANPENIAFSTNITNPPYGNSADLKRNSWDSDDQTFLFSTIIIVHTWNKK